MSYVKSFNWIDFIVIGVDNLIQLKKIIKIFKNKKLNKSEQKQTYVTLESCIFKNE